MSPRWILLLGPLLTACGEEEEEEEEDRISIAPGWSGTEELEIGLSSAPNTSESSLCRLIWNGSGTSSSLTCNDCDFAYDVTFTFDDEASDGVDGCPEDGEDYSFTYGFSSDYNGEPYLFIGYNGGFTPQEPADFNNGTLTYKYVQRSRSAYYPNTTYRHLNYIRYGEATIR